MEPWEIGDDLNVCIYYGEGEVGSGRSFGIKLILLACDLIKLNEK